MAQVILVGIGAGIAGALLFLSPIGATFLAFPLFTLCGLPIAIAGLGWGALSALVAGGVAGVGLFVALSGPAAIVYLALFAAPIVWMSRLAGLSRQPGPDGSAAEWFPIGRVLFHGAIAAAIGVIIVGVVIGYDPETLTQEVTAELTAWLTQSPDVAAPPSGEEIGAFVRLNVLAMPFTLSAILVIILVLDMWLAARIAEASGRLRRPRERLWTAALPYEAAIAFGVAVLVSLVPGAVGHAGGAFVGAVGGALALAGLAIVHAVTAGSNFRTLILVSLYVLLIVFGFPILLLVAVGLADTFFHFRAGRPRGASPTE